MQCRLFISRTSSCQRRKNSGSIHAGADRYCVPNGTALQCDGDGRGICARTAVRDVENGAEAAGRHPSCCRYDGHPLACLPGGRGRSTRRLKNGASVDRPRGHFLTCLPTNAVLRWSKVPGSTATRETAMGEKELQQQAVFGLGGVLCQVRGRAGCFLPSASAGIGAQSVI